MGMGGTVPSSSLIDPLLLANEWLQEEALAVGDETAAIGGGGGSPSHEHNNKSHQQRRRRRMRRRRGSTGGGTSEGGGAGGGGGLPLSHDDSPTSTPYPTTTTTTTNTVVTGVCMYWSRVGWGKIRRDDSGVAIYVHNTSLRAPRAKYRHLFRGERVLFDVGVNDRGPLAINVSGVGGGALRCEEEEEEEGGRGRVSRPLPLPPEDHEEGSGIYLS